MRVWLDDKRPMPWNFDLHVKTAATAILLLQAGMVRVISLDHDLGDEALVGNGYEVAKAIETLAHNGMPRIEVLVHTMNPVGRKNIEAALASAEKAWNTHEV